MVTFSSSSVRLFVCPAMVNPATVDSTANVGLVSVRAGKSTEELNMVNTRPTSSPETLSKTLGGTDIETGSSEVTSTGVNGDE